MKIHPPSSGWATLCVCFFFALFSSGQSLAQSPIDSLKIIAFDKTLPDSARIKALSDLCYEYLLSNQDSSLRYGSLAVSLAEEAGLDKQLAQASSDLGLAYFYRGELQAAIDLWQSTAKVREKLHDDSGVASVQIKLGAAYFKLGDFEQSLAAQMIALKKYEILKNTLGMANALNNIGAVFESQKKFNKALEYYQLTKEAYISLNNNVQVGVTLINIGNVHYLQKAYDSAGYYWNLALSAIPAEALPQYRSIAYNNLGEWYTIQGKYDSALALLQQAIKLRRKINDYQGLTSSMNNLGRVYTFQGKHSLAETTLKAALDSSDRKNLIIEEGKIHQNLYELYRSKGDYRQALNHYVSYKVVEDSLSNERSRKNLDELLVQYESEKKAQQIELQSLQLSEQRAELSRTYILITSLVVVVVLMVIIFVLIRNRHRRKEEIRQREHDIRIREAFIEASIQSQENERKRFAQDLHDGMGQLLSALRITVSKLEGNPSDQTKFSVVEQSEKLLDDMHREIRGIAFNLMPQTLIQSGLTAALKEMAARINETHTFKINVGSFDMPERLLEIQEISLYRIIQEWTNNILKYAAATSIEIQLVGHSNEVTVTVEDNGRGFDPQVLTEGSGNGWKNILSRTKIIKASIEIDSTEGRSGTTLIVQMPKAIPVENRPVVTGRINTQ